MARAEATALAEEGALGGAPVRVAEDIEILAGRSVINFAGAIAFGLFGFLSLVIVARGVGASRAGVFLESVAFFTIATSVVVFGFDESMVRAVARHVAHGEIRTIRTSLLGAVGPLLVLATLVAVVAWLIAPGLARAIDPEAAATLQTYLRTFSVALPFAAAYYAALAATRGLGTMGPTVLIERVGRTVAQTIGIAVVVLAGLDDVALGYAWGLPFVAGSVVAVVVLFRGLARAEAGNPAAAAPRASLGATMREFWAFSSLRGIASVLQTTFLWVDTLIVGALLTSSATAIYTTSGRLVRLGALVLMAIVQAIAPQISGLLSRRERSRAEHVYRISTWWLMAATWPAYVTMVVFAPVVLRVFGSDFTVGGEVVAIMCLGMLVSTALGAVDVVLLMGGKSGWNLLNTAIALVVIVVGDLLLVPRFGIEGAAVAWAVSVAVNNVLPYLEVKRLLGMTPFARPGAIPALASVGAFGVVGLFLRALLGPTIAAAAITVVLGTTIYVLVLRRAADVLELGALRTTFARPFTSRRSRSEPGPD